MKRSSFLAATTMVTAGGEFVSNPEHNRGWTMKKAVVVLAVCLSSVINVHADAASLVASPNPSVVGQTVMFTATFNHYCSDGVDSAVFTIDGTPHSVQALGDPTATARLSTSTLGVGTHLVRFDWSASQAGTSTACSGSALIYQTVKPKPAPPPSQPKPNPSPLSTPTPPPPPPASPAASPSESPTASSARLTVDVSTGGSAAPSGPLAMAGLALLFLLGGLTWLRFQSQRRK
jgi:hypothetical protein